MFALGADDAGGECLKLEAQIEHAHELDINRAAWGPGPRAPVAVDEEEMASGAGAHVAPYMLATCGDDEVVKLWAYTPPYNPHAVFGADD